MRNKNLLGMILILLLGLLLAAYGGVAAAAPATEAPAATEEATASADCAEPVTIEYWHINTQDDRKAVIQEAIDAFEKDNPCAKINVTVLENEAFKAKMTTVMQSNEPPDVFTTWGGGVMNEYAKAGLLRDITVDIQKDGFADTFGAGPLAVYSYEGKQYGVAMDQGMVGFWYNKELFKKAGIDAPPATWTDLLDDVKKLKDAGITPISLGEGDKWPGHFWWVYLSIRLGGKEAFDAAYSRQGSFADEPFVQAGEKLQELIALEPFQDGYLGLTYNDQARAVGNGEAAMELMGQWAPGVQKDESADKQGLGDKLGWFSFPEVEGGKGDPSDALGGGGGWLVGRDAPDEAVTFLKYLSSKEFQCGATKINWILPVVKGTEECITDPLMKTIAENAAKAPYLQLYYDQALPPAVGSVVNDSVQELFASTKTPEEVGQAIEDSAAMELSGAPAVEAPAATECTGEPVNIEYWHITTDQIHQGVLNEAIARFEKDNPCAKVNVTVLENEAFKTKMTTVMQSGEPPDVFQSWGGGVMNEYVKAGLLRDITADLDKGGWRETYGAGPLAVYSFEGKNYGVPRDQGMVGFWYNKELFKKAGIDASPATWADLLDDVKKLKDAGITPISLGEGDKWPGHFWWVYLAIRLGGKEAFDAAYSREGSFADKPFVQAGEKLQELIALEPFQDGYLGLTYNDQARAMGNGEAAMELMGQWAPAVEKDNSADKQGIGDKLGWFPFPEVEGGKGDPADALGGGNGWTIGKNAPDEAVTFLKYLTTKEQQCAETKVGLTVPVVDGTAECIDDPLLKTVAENAAKAPYLQLYYDQALPPAVGSVVNDSVQELFAGTKTPEEVGQTIEDSAAMELGQ